MTCAYLRDSSHASKDRSLSEFLVKVWRCLLAFGFLVYLGFILGCAVKKKSVSSHQLLVPLWPRIKFPSRSVSSSLPVALVYLSVPAQHPVAIIASFTVTEGNGSILRSPSTFFTFQTILKTSHTML